jgi:hypothetical protein
MLEGLMLLCFAVATFFERIRSPFGREEEVEVGPANAGEPPGPLPEPLLHVPGEAVAGRAGGQP